MQNNNKKQKLAIDDMKAPPKDSPQYDYVGGLLESVKSDFRAFGEVQNLILEKLNRVEKRGDATFEIVGEMKIELTDHTDRLERIEDKLGIKELVEV